MISYKGARIGFIFIFLTFPLKADGFEDGLQFYEQGEMNKAHASFQSYLRKEPNDDLAWLYLGLTYQATELWSESEEAWIAGLELDGEHRAEIAFLLGNLYLYLEKFARAHDAFSLASVKLPAAFLNKANLFLSQEKYSEALQAYKTYIKLRPFDKQREKIFKLIALLEQKNPSNTVLQEELNTVDEQAGRKAVSDEHFQQSEPKNSAAGSSAQQNSSDNNHSSIQPANQKNANGTASGSTSQDNKNKDITNSAQQQSITNNSEQNSRETTANGSTSQGKQNNDITKSAQQQSITNNSEQNSGETTANGSTSQGKQNNDITKSAQQNKQKSINETADSSEQNRADSSASQSQSNNATVDSSAEQNNQNTESKDQSNTQRENSTEQNSNVTEPPQPNNRQNVQSKDGSLSNNTFDYPNRTAPQQLPEIQQQSDLAEIDE